MTWATGRVSTGWWYEYVLGGTSSDVGIGALGTAVRCVYGSTPAV